MSESDLVQLYSKRILALAADIPYTQPLASPDGMGKERSPQCGSTVTVGVSLREGVIDALGLDVKACALGQASAAIFGRGAIGASRSDIEAGLAALNKLLANSTDVDTGRWPDMEVLRAAAEFPNRHASIRLVWLATLAAIAEASSA